MKRFFFVFVLLICLAPSLPAQENFPQHYFRMPMDIPPRIAGNFGELRPNHFHAGLDFSTSNREGIPVHASAEGYVTRIKVGPYGYGRVLYVMHPNGYLTVYAHLSRFSKEIAAYVEKEQYARRSFEIELFPLPGQLPVKQGETIGLSGNTGSSGGPHLHFEIRDAASEDALNPQLFGLPIGDSVSPTPQSLAVYALSAASTVKGAKAGRKKIALKKSGGKYIFASAADSLVVSGAIGFALEGFDQEDVRHGRNGVYGISLYQDGRLIYSHRIRRMGFDESRYINCFIDYAELKETKKFYQKSFTGPNNQLPIYDSLRSRGILLFSGDSLHQMKYVISDVKGNNTVIEFTVRGEKASVKTADAPKKHKWNQENVLESAAAFRCVIPSGALYEDADLKFSVSPPAKGSDWPVVSLHNEKTPLQLPCSLTVKTTGNIPDSLRSKLLVVNLGPKGGKSSLGGTFENNAISTTIKEFGIYTVVPDTTAPKVQPSNFDLKGVQKNLSSLKMLGFTVSDDLSGIGSYQLFIDGKWVLLEYEPKKKLLYHSFDSRTGAGAHELVLRVSDKTGNTTEYRKAFTR